MYEHMSRADECRAFVYHQRGNFDRDFRGLSLRLNIGLLALLYNQTDKFYVRFQFRCCGKSRES